MKKKLSMSGGNVPTEACTRCPRDELKDCKERLARTNKSIEAIIYLREMYLDSFSYKDLLAGYGELLIRRAEEKKRIKRLKSEIKERKAKKKKDNAN